MNQKTMMVMTIQLYVKLAVIIILIAFHVQPVLISVKNAKMDIILIQFLFVLNVKHLV